MRACLTARDVAAAAVGAWSSTVVRQARVRSGFFAPPAFSLDFCKLLPLSLWERGRG